jgi:hypothetical protein
MEAAEKWIASNSPDDFTSMQDIMVNGRPYDSLTERQLKSRKTQFTRALQDIYEARHAKEKRELEREATKELAERIMAALISNEDIIPWVLENEMGDGLLSPFSNFGSRGRSGLL